MPAKPYSELEYRQASMALMEYTEVNSGLQEQTLAQARRQCERCGAQLASDHQDKRCSPCVHAEMRPDQPETQSTEFWHDTAIREALGSQHFGRFMAAYRAAHDPTLPQTMLGHWLGITQHYVSRLERSDKPISDLVKLRRWAGILRVPHDLLWFSSGHSREESGPASSAATLDDVDRRDMLKLTGAAVVAGPAILADAPWTRKAATLAGQRAADASTVAMIETDTDAFFRSEETKPARELVAALRAHLGGLRRLIDSTESESLQRRLITTAGETEALAGWTLFDLQRPREAERLYRSALKSANEAGDGPLAACVLGYWSYLLSARNNSAGAVRMLDAASDHVRGSAAATQAWITARRAEEQAAAGDAGAALRALDQAVTVFDYGNVSERPWTCFFTATRLGGLAVSTYGRLAHPAADQVANDLLSSIPATETKVKALVLADLASSAAHSGDYDRMRALTDQAAPLAVRTEASLAVDRLWDLVEAIPENSAGTAGQARARLTNQLLGGKADA